MTYAEGVKAAMEQCGWTDETVYQRLGFRLKEGWGNTGTGARQMPAGDEPDFVATVVELFQSVNDLWIISPDRTRRTFGALLTSIMRDEKETK